MDHILILGGDGYLGWPTAMRFSAKGHPVTVVDNSFRRDISQKLGCTLLYDIPSLPDRAKAWHEATGNEIKVVIVDLAQPESMNQLFQEQLTYDWCISPQWTGIPQTVIHYAEQPSAPYSMLNRDTADHTLINNIRVTNNLIWSVKENCPESHIIKLGTMGEYGTPNIDIEEGWLDVSHNGREQRFLYPRQASSLYHTTKIMDTDLLWFAVRLWDLKVTDLMQGPVYGISTRESDLDPRLKTLFNYDEIFGTIINRFVVQAICGYPLTVYGEGGQTRGYLNLNDTLQCVEISEQNPAKRGEMRIFNQIMETFSVNELANRIQRAGHDFGLQVEIKKIDNPRKEMENHYYNPTYQGLQSLGVQPHYLTDDVLAGMFTLVNQHATNIDKDIIFKGVKF